MDSHAPPAAHDAAHDAAYAEWISEARSVPITRPLERLAARLVVRSGELVGPCPVCGGRDRFAVSLRKGVFHCRGSGEGGDVIALTRYLEACDFHTACAILTGRNRPGREVGESTEARADRQAALAKRAAALARVTEEARRTEARFRERERMRCWQLWRAAQPLPGTAAEAYLALRGLAAPPEAPLRCLPDHPLYAAGRAQVAIVHRGPALVAPIVRPINGPSGRFAGLHTTWIDLAEPDGKARIRDPETGLLVPARKVRGSARGGRIPLVSVPEPEDLVIGEGIETVLSVWRAHAACGWARRATAAYWAAYSLDNIGGPAVGTVPHPTERLRDSRGRERPRRVKGPVPDLARPGLVLPETTRRVWLLGDGDSDRFITEAALLRAAARFHAARPDLEVYVAWAPDGQDFNDVLRRVAA